MYKNSLSYRSQAPQQAINYQWAANFLVKTAQEYSNEDNPIIGPNRSSSLRNYKQGIGYKLNIDIISPTVVSIVKNDHNLSCDQNLAVAMTNFYEKLSTHQVSLGQEIEQIVNNSLWDLYLD